MDLRKESRIAALSPEEEARIETLARTKIHEYSLHLSQTVTSPRPEEGSEAKIARVTSKSKSDLKESGLTMEDTERLSYISKLGGMDRFLGQNTNLEQADYHISGSDLFTNDGNSDEQVESPRSELPSSTTVKGPKRRKICLVCGDRAIGCNFGVVSCESCKAFFRRMAYRVIRGRCRGACVVDVESRVYCKSCRLKKCFDVGMKREMIVNDSKLKPDPHVVPVVKYEADESTTLSEEPQQSNWTDQDKLRLTELYQAFQPMHSPKSQASTEPGTLDIINMADTSVRRLITCVKALKCFSALSMPSQIELLKYSAIEVLILSSSKQYDPDRQSWNLDKTVRIDKIEREGHAMMQEMMSGYISFVTTLKPLLRDDLNVLNLLITICLLSLDIELEAEVASNLSRHQEQYAYLLQRYTRSHFQDRLLFPKLIMKLADLKYLKEMHCKLLNSVDVKLVAPLLKEVFSVC